MKLSLRGEYALQALMLLARESGRDVVRIQFIAEKESIPKRFLEQILNDLRAEGFVESKRGVAGGYRLRGRPEEISLASVLKSVEGSFSPLAEADRQGRTSHSPGNEERQAIRAVMNSALEAVLKMLDQLTLADLCRRAEQIRSRSAGSPDYSI